MPNPHNILPKPYGKGHPPIWVACGNPPTFAKAGELGIGAIAFNFEPIYNLQGRIDAYKEGDPADCTEPIGQFKNDNVMMTNAVICLEDRKQAREIALRKGRGYLVTMVNLYHDTMPKSPDAITWPERADRLQARRWTDELLDELIEGGYMLLRHARRGVRADRRVPATSAGPARVRPARRGHATHDEILEMLELFGDKVIPEFDQRPGALHHPLPRGCAAPLPRAVATRSPPTSRSSASPPPRSSRSSNEPASAGAG